MTLMRNDMNAAEPCYLIEMDNRLTCDCHLAWRFGEINLGSILLPNGTGAMERRRTKGRPAAAGYS
jgi:hypothetical protein